MTDAERWSNRIPKCFMEREKMKGPAGNRNAGAARAMGEWIVFIDDDCIAQKDTFWLI